MTDLSAVVYDALCAYGVQNKPLYIACSGGRDSMVLAHTCIMLYRTQKIRMPVILHVNHHLQDAAASWSALVQAFATQYNVPCRVLDIFLPNASENTARLARYQACYEQMLSDSVLLLAHHLDDNAETVLMRLVNGTSLHGLTGIAAYRAVTLADKQLHVCRPLLALSRATITAWAQAQKLPYVDDPTNSTGDNARSLIRQHIMPKLQQLNPKAAHNIHRTTLLLHNAQQIVQANLPPLADLLIKNEAFSAGQGLDIVALGQYSTPVQLALLAQFIKNDADYGASYDFVQRVWQLCHTKNSDHNTQLQWQASVFCRYDKVLYRYNNAFWQTLTSMPSTLTYRSDGYYLLLGDKEFFSGYKTGLAQKIDKNTVVSYRHKHLSGKKLYQTLRIPVWLRAHLYLIDDVALVSFGQRWLLNAQDAMSPNHKK